MSSSEITALRRQLKIKSGVVKREIKELNLYRQEEQEQVTKVDKLKSEGADAADLRQAVKVLDEARKMVPDAQSRLQKAVADLKDLTNQATTIPDLAEDPDYMKAKEAIGEAEL